MNDEARDEIAIRAVLVRQESQGCLAGSQRMGEVGVEGRGLEPDTVSGGLQGSYHTFAFWFEHAAHGVNQSATVSHSSGDAAHDRFLELGHASRIDRAQS